MSIDDENIARSENEIKIRELDIKEKELKNQYFIEIIKIITTGVVVTLIPAILTHLIQKQELEIQTLKGEMEYLKQFSDKVVDRDDLIKRRNFVEYLATVAHSKESRERWYHYLIIVTKEAEKQEKIEKELSEKNAEAMKQEQQVASLQEELELARKKGADLESIKNKLNESTKKLSLLDGDILEKSVQRDAIIERAKISNRPPSFENEITELVSGMNSVERSVRVRSVARLIEKYSTDSVAIGLSLNSLSPPLLDNLSPSGRINVLVFLRNTARSTWTNDNIKKAKEVIHLIKERDQQGITKIGDQTKEALDAIEKFTREIDR